MLYVFSFFVLFVTFVVKIKFIKGFIKRWYSRIYKELRIK